MSQSSSGYLVVKNLTVTFSKLGQIVHALTSISLTVLKGQWLILAGPNGSGKSTLLNIISSRLTVNEESVFIDGRSLATFAPEQLTQVVFLVHQNPLVGTAPDMTVFENLIAADYQAEMDRVPKQQLRKKYLKLLAPLGLQDRLDQLVQPLSKGELQLLALLIVQLRPASLVLLDEPLAALDPVNAQMCLKQISELHRLGKTIIQVTHEPKLAMTLGDRTIALQSGRIVYDRLASSREPNDVAKLWSEPVFTNF
jgi:putative ABC transport system ATP-binding protein